MINLEKRNLLLGAATALAGAGAAAATGAAAPAPTAQDPRDAMRRKHFPNVPLVTHAGKEVLFYDDLLKGKKVVINFMYTVCEGICSPVTQNIVDARALLGEAARDIHFYSISLKPLDDDPPALREYMADHQVGEGWTFLTGTPDNVNLVRRGLGFSKKYGEQDTDLSNHSGMLRLGNEPIVNWSHASGISSGKTIARMIRFELT
jgi:protein SCO1